jgi:hypothetical protein
MRLPRHVNIDEILANSFKDYHVKGFDYVCLKRSPTETLKLYFFDGDVSKLPEVVNPHDHRYDFDTWVICGRTENKFRTPLNGGNGFTWKGECRIKETASCVYQPGEHYFMKADEFHTIRIVENESVIMLRQLEDVVPLDVPTRTFTRSETPPSLAGLYSRFTPDQVLARLKQFEERTGYQFWPA